MPNQACPTCKREGYIKPLDNDGRFRCGYCGDDTLCEKPKEKEKELPQKE